MWKIKHYIVILGLALGVCMFLLIALYIQIKYGI
jgi:hypothetical protein